MLHHSHVRRVAALASCAIALAMLAVGVAGAQVQGRSQTRCIGALNKSAYRVTKAVGKNVAACLRDGSLGDLPIDLDAQACAEGDYRGNVGVASSHTVLAAEIKCDVQPDFGATDAETTNTAALAESRGLVADVFGDDLTTTLATMEADRATADCQRAIGRRAERLLRARLKRFVRCKVPGLRDGSLTSEKHLAACLDRSVLDQDGGLTRALEALDVVLAARCRGVNLAGAFPGSCLGADSMSACVERRAACRVCRIVHEADALSMDCDVYDDAAANGSCETPPTHPAVCGNGSLEPGEECDDGATVSGDCCSATCRLDARGAACTTDSVACTADVCDGAGVCTHDFTCRWRFTDVTVAAGIDYEHAYDETQYEGAALDRAIIGGGVAAGDYDGDGWVDLYAVGGAAGVSQLLHNRGDGTFENVASAAAVEISGGFGSGPVFADYDGDGHLDLMIGGLLDTALRVFRNMGDGTFVDATASSKITVDYDTFGAAFADYDKDGDLDVFLAHWQQPIVESARLWRNEGDGSFTDVTALAELDIDRDGSGLDWAFTPTFADIDNDGWSDLLIAADFGNSQVFLNDRDGTFTDATTAIIDDENGMGAAVGDYDNDGDLDWFVSSIWDPNGVAEANWGVTGNRLYRNSGDGTFENATDAAGVREGYWGWGSCRADFDLDGHLDIFHVNGFSTDSADEYYEDPARLFLGDGDGDGTFTEFSAEVAIDETAQGRGVVCFDYDRDGDVDIFVANNNGAPRLWNNNATTVLANGFLSIKLRAPGPNGEGIGARVFVTTGDETQMREVRAGSNFESQDPAVAHFGVADAALVDEIRVEWPDGAVTTIEEEWPSQHMLVLHPDLAGVRFADVSVAAGLDYLQRASPVIEVQPPAAAEQPTGGAAAGDYDNDGWVDLVVTRADAAPILFRNDDGAGTFTDVTASAGDLATSVPTGSNGVAWGDIDNDGDLDLYMTSYGTSRWHLFINEGDGTFSEDAVARGAALDTGYDHYGMGVAFGDYDLDGYLDLFVTEWWVHPLPPAPQLPGQSQNRLLRNLGAAAPGHFVDVTEAAGFAVEVLPPPVSMLGTPGFSPGFVDFDGDGWPDLAWVADFGLTRLFWNNADGTFTDATEEANVAIERAGMGSTQDDFNGDGLIDWYATAIFGRPQEIRLGVSSQLYVNNGDRTFANATIGAGVANGGFGWGTSGFDFDNDGDIDIIATNGMLQPGHPEELPWLVGRTRLFENYGSATFVEVGVSRGVTDKGLGRGLLTFDYDRDGDLDAFVANHGGTPVLYRNDGGNLNGWLQIELVGTLSNRFGIGAVITVDPDASDPADDQTQHLLDNSNFVSHDELIAHFGLGGHSGMIDRITVRWPSGIVQVVEGQAANTRLTIAEP